MQPRRNEITTFSTYWWKIANKGTRISFAINFSCNGTGSWATLGSRKYCHKNHVRRHYQVNIVNNQGGKLQITWKGPRSAWRTVIALMDLHRDSSKLVKILLFWIADRRSGTHFGQEFFLTNSATTTIRNWKHIQACIFKNNQKKKTNKRIKRGNYRFDQNFKHQWLGLEQN